MAVAIATPISSQPKDKIDMITEGGEEIAF